MESSTATNSSFPAKLPLVIQVQWISVHCSYLTIKDFAVQAEMVAVETSIDVGNILWIFYDCLSPTLFVNIVWCGKTSYVLIQLYKEFKQYWSEVKIFVDSPAAGDYFRGPSFCKIVKHFFHKSPLPIEKNLYFNPMGSMIYHIVGEYIPVLRIWSHDLYHIINVWPILVLLIWRDKDNHSCYCGLEATDVHWGYTIGLGAIPNENNIDIMIYSLPQKKVYTFAELSTQNWGGLYSPWSLSTWLCRKWILSFGGDCMWWA